MFVQNNNTPRRFSPRHLIALLLIALFALPGVALSQPKQGKKPKAERKAEKEERKEERKAEKEERKSEQNAAKDERKADREGAKEERNAAKDERKAERNAAKDERKAERNAAKEARKDGKGKGRDVAALINKEKKKHIKRSAQFDRIEELAKQKKSDTLLKKVQMLRDKEAKRHARAMKRLGGEGSESPAEETPSTIPAKL